MSTKQPAKMINGKLCFTTGAMCEILGITRETLSRWDSMGCPKVARGWWPFREVLIWRGVLSPSGFTSENEPSHQNLYQKKLAAEARLKEQKAEEAEFKNTIVRSDYIPKEEAAAVLKRLYSVLKRSMLAYSRQITKSLSSYVDSVTAGRVGRMVTDLSLDALEQLSIDGVFTAPKKKAKGGQ